MFYLRHSTSGFIDVLLSNDLDGGVPASGIENPDIQIAKGHASFAPPNDGIWIEWGIETGRYTVQVDTADVDTLGAIKLHVHPASGAMNFDDNGYVLSQEVYDTWFGSATISGQVNVGLSQEHGDGDWTGGGDWSDAEKGNIRWRLGVNGAVSIPSVDPHLENVTISGIIVTLDALNLPDGIKKNTAFDNFSFVMMSGQIVVPGATVSVKRSIDGGAFNDATNTPATEISDGAYKINFSAADFNGDFVLLQMATADGLKNFIGIKTEQ